MGMPMQACGLATLELAWILSYYANALMYSKTVITQNHTLLRGNSLRTHVHGVLHPISLQSWVENPALFSVVSVVVALSVHLTARYI